MSRRIFEFLCEQGHRSEKLIDSTSLTTDCPVCQEPAKRVISRTHMKLEGITGAFPTAYDAWTRDHEHRYQQTKKRREEQEAA